MKKKLIPNIQTPQPKPVSAIVDAFVNTFSPVMSEDEADDCFTVAKLREYFNAWPIPKMPDPLPPYVKELAERGYLMITGYDGRPAIFVRRYISTAHVISMKPTHTAELEYEDKEVCGDEEENEIEDEDDYIDEEEE